VQNRLDFRRIVRIGAVMGWPGQSRPLKGVRSKGCLPNKNALAMIFKLAEAAEKNWRRLDGHNQLPKLLWV
jgi:hypothetical protein